MEDQLTQLSGECSNKQKTIEELERRREMAKKEIQNLYNRIQKKGRTSELIQEDE